MTEQRVGLGDMRSELVQFGAAFREFFGDEPERIPAWAGRLAVRRVDHGRPEPCVLLRYLYHDGLLAGARATGTREFSVGYHDSPEPCGVGWLVSTMFDETLEVTSVGGGYASQSYRMYGSRLLSAFEGKDYDGDPETYSLSVAAMEQDDAVWLPRNPDEALLRRHHGEHSVYGVTDPEVVGGLLDDGLGMLDSCLSRWSHDGRPLVAATLNESGAAG